MSQTTREAAQTLRYRIFSVLGDKCAGCGTEEDLTLDCIKPMGPRAHRGGYIGRQWFYYSQYRLGNIQILCERCQQLKGTGTQAEFLSKVRAKYPPEEQ